MCSSHLACVLSQKPTCTHAPRTYPSARSLVVMTVLLVFVQCTYTYTDQSAGAYHLFIRCLSYIYEDKTMSPFLLKYTAPSPVNIYVHVTDLGNLFLFLCMLCACSLTFVFRAQSRLYWSVSSCWQMHLRAHHSLIFHSHRFMKNGNMEIILLSIGTERNPRTTDIRTNISNYCKTWSNVKSKFRTFLTRLALSFSIVYLKIKGENIMKNPHYLPFFISALKRPIMTTYYANDPFNQWTPVLFAFTTNVHGCRTNAFI